MSDLKTMPQPDLQTVLNWHGSCAEQAATWCAGGRSRVRLRCW